MAVVVGALALLVRVPNLGQFSMWLDEVLETLMVRGSFAASLAALARDAVHPPLEGVLSWVLVHAGATETLRRFASVGFGIGTVLVLCRWVGGRFGAPEAWVAGVLAALSPVHVHYSQELRPYSMGLFFLVLALWRFDVLLAKPTYRNASLLWLVCLGCLYSLYLSAGILLVLAGAAILASLARDPARRLVGRRLVAGLPGFTAALMAAYSPWIVAVWCLANQKIAAGPSSWSLRFWGARWQFLTVAGKEGEALRIGAELWLVLCLVGAVLAVSRPAARLVVAGALVGTLGMEIGLVVAGHWSNGRYDLTGWPFLITLAALGITAPAAGLAPRPPQRRVPRHRLAVSILLTVVAAAAEVQGLARYYRSGRPHWDRVAEFVQSRRRDYAAVFASNEWTRACLDYYLDERWPRGLAEERIEPVSLNGSPARLREAARKGTASLVVVGGYPRSRALQAELRKHPRIARFGSTGVRVFAVLPASQQAPLSRGYGRPSARPRPARAGRPGAAPRWPGSRAARPASGGGTPTRRRGA